MQQQTSFVRPARPGDLTPVADLHAAYLAWLSQVSDQPLAPFRLLPPGSGAAATTGFAAARADQTPGTHLLVATEADQVVGFALAVSVANAPATAAPAPDSSPLVALAQGAPTELAYLVVSPAAGPGHGERLLAALTDVCRAEELATLRAWVPAPDTALAGLLTAAGFAETGVAVRFADAPTPLRAHLYVTRL
ncbi:GNAT family N-acetyltransferase [Buchananella hordeovulneris]|uniref:N-acetyltransferase domain-containing protein n=1 Tax=Buchananella hordeovulneris TaxID=52770 RepID=A0A1Q5PVG4_9ACTO|nr:GNAT family N-acetyltransferase [Buchananella hordeovulneris]OKL51571.1 hypothetical protein BSZ40_06925 [Buchananella hordeovulneris]RRD52172.1 GNAT family N-acetyltransferase [Buchananella hordeovulneris]